MLMNSTSVFDQYVADEWQLVKRLGNLNFLVKDDSVVVVNRALNCVVFSNFVKKR